MRSASRSSTRPPSFTARKYADGSVSGHFTYHQIVEGQSFNFGVDVTCLVIYDGNRAKIGGEIKTSNDPTLPPGGFAWFQVFDNGEGANALPDRSSLIGFGDEAANEAFCNSANLPRFGPWDVHGNAQSRPSRYPRKPKGPRRAAPSLPSVRMTVRDNPALQRYEAIVDGELAGSIFYREREDELVLVHTQVEAEFEGRGIGGRLIVATLDDIRARGLRMRPFCPS